MSASAQAGSLPPQLLTSDQRSNHAAASSEEEVIGAEGLEPSGIYGYFYGFFIRFSRDLEVLREMT